jgi:hypothetical protein
MSLQEKKSTTRSPKSYSPGKHPQAGLGLNPINDYKRRGKLIMENPGIPLIPNFPHGKKCEGGDSFVMRRGAFRQKGPPILDV